MEKNRKKNVFPGLGSQAWVPINVKGSETKKAPKPNFFGKFCRQKILGKFWPMGDPKKV